MQKVHIFHQDKKYSIDSSVFIKHSKYFSNKEYNDIILFSEVDYSFNCTEEDIDMFIQYFYDKDIQINNSNIILLNYLSQEYSIESLIQKTENYINEHYYELVEEYLNKISDKDKKEVLFIIKFFKLTNFNRLLTFSIHTIHQILFLYFKSETLKTITENISEIINILNELISEKGSESFSLFPLFKFENNNFLNEQVYSQINFFSEFDNTINHSNESIKSFIQYLQKEKIEINNSNVITLNFLSQKYEVHELINETENYIESHYHEIIEKFIIESENELNDINEKCEDILSHHLHEFFNDDRLISIPISTLYRIFSRYLKFKEENQIINLKQEEEEIEMIDFLNKCLQVKGSQAKILFSIVKFDINSFDYLKGKMKDIKNNDDKIKFQTALLENPSYIFNNIEYLKDSFDKRLQKLEDQLKAQEEIHKRDVEERSNIEKKN